MANTSNTNKKKVSAEQLNMLVDFIGVNKVLLHGKTKPSEAQDDVIHKLWEEIAARLNSCGSGPAKPKAQWKKTFIDWKSNTRRKSRDLVKSQRRTGGGEDEIKGLTAAEEKLMSLLSWITVIGVEDVAEIGIDEAEKAVDNPSSSFITLPSSSSPPPSPVTVLPNIETTVQKRKWLNQHNAADSGPTLKKTKTAGKGKQACYIMLVISNYS
ncbi:hypothetical protein RI129_003057 [Pyrocoelia pectoralis]|uniref:Regulatory protein zeste n=1 Tax=Pyrocoelia pectoralis TaxID=417401 RepID=A0AAN7VH61_9COLE